MASEKKLLEELEKETVDTSSWMVGDPDLAREAFERADYKLRGGVANPLPEGRLRAWHVTDDPEAVLELIRRGTEFHEREGDLCSGLYVSAAPHYWHGRSTKRWEFLKEMPKEARDSLYVAIYDRLVEEATTGYITTNEWENAQRIMAQAITTDYWPVLALVSDQPFNINIQKLAKERGLAIPHEPAEVPVEFVGRYLEFNTERAIDAYKELLKKRYGTLENVGRADLCDMLESYGWDGIYTQSGFGTNPELVIWNPEKVVRFGDWERTESSADLSGTRERMVIWDPESRFEGRISINRRRADIIDVITGTYMTVLSREDLESTRQIIHELQELWHLPELTRKFKREMKNNPVYLRTLNQLKDLSWEELGQLLEILNQMIPVMA